MNTFQTAFMFDYGNREPLMEILQSFCKKYVKIPSEAGFIFFVNNIPYNLEFYLIFETENEELFEVGRKLLQKVAIKELSLLTTRQLIKYSSTRRFDSISIPADINLIQMMFPSLFRFPERKYLIEKGYGFLDDISIFPPNTIFFSYANKKLRNDIIKIKSLLTAEAYPVFFDIQSLFPGDNLEDKIKSYIVDAQAIVFFIDDSFMRSKFCKQELDITLENNIKHMFIIDKNLKEEYKKSEPKLQFTNSLFIETDFNNINHIELYKKIKEFIHS